MGFFVIVLSFILTTILFLKMGSKIRDNFVFEKTIGEEIIDLNDAVKFLGKGDKREQLDGILYLTNKRLIFFKYKNYWLSFIPFVGESTISMFIDKSSYWELPLHQIKHFTFKPEITYYNHRSVEIGRTYIHSSYNEAFEFDIFVLGMAEKKVPNILIKLKEQLRKEDKS